MKHFAIVSYTFPPSKEIGGRRWANFSLQLKKKGHQVSVICENQHAEKKFYQRYFDEINFYFFPNRYPTWLTGVTHSFFERIAFFFVFNFWNKITKRNILDKGFALKKPMLNILSKIHNNSKIDVLIVTGAPFSLLAYGAEFKKKHPEVIYVSDFRDPWSWGSYYGIPEMTKFKFNFQKNQEKETIKYSDFVSIPTQFMRNDLKRLYNKNSDKLLLLPHAFNPEKFDSINKSQERSGFIYGGTIYKGISQYLSKLVKTLNSNGLNDFKWDIYTGSKTDEINSLFSDFNVRTYGLISEEILFEKISKAKAYLAFYPPADKDLVSTKFFEIINTGTPIIYIGEEGEVARFVRENKVGVHILPSEIESEFPKFLNGDIQFENNKFEVSKYSFSNVTDHFLDKIIS